MGIAERKEREKEQRRNDIVDAAEKVFFTKGIQHATMDEIAELAELSKGTLYLYFKSKEELLFAVDLRAMKIMSTMMMTAVSKKKSTLDNIVAIGNAYVQFSKDYPDYFQTLLYFEGDDFFNKKHEMFEKLCGDDTDPMQFFADYLRQGIKDGSIRSDMDPALLAHLLWSTTTGILKLAKTKELHGDLDEASEDDIIQNHFNIIRNGIRNK